MRHFIALGGNLHAFCSAPSGAGSGGGGLVAFDPYSDDPHAKRARVHISDPKGLVAKDISMMHSYHQDDSPELTISEYVASIEASTLSQINADVVGNCLNATVAWDDGKVAFLIFKGVDPNNLTDHGRRLLGVGSWFAHLGRPFNYTDVQDITSELFGKAMNTAMIYRTIEDLTRRGFLIDMGRMTDEESGRPVSHYQISDAGREALRGAVLNSCILEKLQANAA